MSQSLRRIAETHSFCAGASDDRLEDNSDSVLHQRGELKAAVMCRADVVRFHWQALVTDRVVSSMNSSCQRRVNIDPVAASDD